MLAAPQPEYPSYPGSTSRPRGHGLFLIHFDAKTGQAVSVEVARSTLSNILDQAAVRTLMKWRCKPGAYTKVFVPITYNGPN